MAEIIEVNDNTFDAEVLNAGKPAVVDFWAPWCGPCRMMHPILETVAGDMEGKAIVGRCNVDESPALAGRFNITAIPTMILFNNGEAVDFMIGVTPEEEIKKRLESHI